MVIEDERPTDVTPGTAASRCEMSSNVRAAWWLSLTSPAVLR